MLDKPIVLHQYDDNGKQAKEFKLCLIPWGMMKKIVSLSDKFDKNGSMESVIDEMTKLICDLYRNQFTPEDVNDHFDGKEVMQAIKELMAETGLSNPNLPAEPKK